MSSDAMISLRRFGGTEMMLLQQIKSVTLARKRSKSINRGQRRRHKPSKPPFPPLMTTHTAYLSTLRKQTTQAPVPQKLKQIKVEAIRTVVSKQVRSLLKRRKKLLRKLRWKRKVLQTQKTTSIMDIQPSQRLPGSSQIARPLIIIPTLIRISSTSTQMIFTIKRSPIKQQI